MRSVATIVVAVALVTWSCGDEETDRDNAGGNTTPGITCESLAATVGACSGGTTEQEWRDLCGLVVLSSACLTAMRDAPCSEHASADPSFEPTCFPPCNPATNPASCNGDGTIDMCPSSSSALVRYRCAGVCAQQGSSYSGTCADSYNGNPSSTGQDVCWCQ